LTGKVFLLEIFLQSTDKLTVPIHLVTKEIMLTELLFLKKILLSNNCKLRTKNLKS
jgi:hypothetical protein